MSGVQDDRPDTPGEGGPPPTGALPGQGTGGHQLPPAQPGPTPPAQPGAAAAPATQAAPPPPGYPTGPYPAYTAGPYPGYAPGAPPAPRTNGLAIASLACSLGGLLTWFTAIAGIVCGHIALKQISQTGEEGRGLAVAGLAVGYTLVAIGVIAVALTLLFAVFVAGVAITSG